MNAITLNHSRDARDGAETALVDFTYTICPVLTASNIAVLHRLFDEEIARAGGRPTYLRSLPDNAGWLPHFSHQYADLFRDGGAIPPIHARASGVDTVLVGVTWVREGSGGQIIVRADSGIHRVADLAGRRLGLFRSLNGDKVDFRRATAHRQLLLALELAGIEENAVEWVNIDDPDAPHYRQARDLVDYFAQGRVREEKQDSEREALASGLVDAIHVGAGRATALVATGEFAAIEDLSRYPDWRLQVSNSPFLTTVNRDFAERHPEIVIAWLRAAIRAGRWANRDKVGAAELLTRVSSLRDARAIAAILAETDLVPSLSPANLGAVAEQKRFLADKGYIDQDFEVRDWVDDRYITEALASL